MLEVLFNKKKDDSLKVLLLGAHCDDIEIGCGGTVLELASRYPSLSVDWVVLASNDERAREAEACARNFLNGVADATITIERFRDGYFPYEGGRVKDYFEDLKKRVLPDVIFTHFRDDWHQDHRLVCELTWNTWRNHLILEYEIPKYDPDIGSPNCFLHLDEATAEDKVRRTHAGISHPVFAPVVHRGDVLWTNAAARYPIWRAEFRGGFLLS